MPHRPGEDSQQQSVKCAKKGSLLKCLIPSLIFGVLILVGFIILIYYVQTRYPPEILWEKSIHKIPSRDGVKLYTEIYKPLRRNSKTLGVILIRTPYDFPRNEKGNIVGLNAFQELNEKGYYYVWQSVRGKGESEGVFVSMTKSQNLAVGDDVSDATFTIEWLLKNIEFNGNVAMMGVGYEGFTALSTLADPHPSIKACVPLFPLVDMFQDGIFRQNGVMKLATSVNFLYGMEHDHGHFFDYNGIDQSQFYKDVLPLNSLEEKLNNSTTFKFLMNSTMYDQHWEHHSLLKSKNIRDVPTLIVGGWRDQESLRGIQLFYEKAKSSIGRIHLLLGPWYQQQWKHVQSYPDDEVFQQALSQISKFINYNVHGSGNIETGHRFYSFRLGEDKWYNYTKDTWFGTESTNFNLSHDGLLDPKPKFTDIGNLAYKSNPHQPVPFTQPPIRHFENTILLNGSWIDEDQVFASYRPDVVTFSSKRLESDTVIQGKASITIDIESTQDDFDIIVKLIDAFPSNPNDTQVVGKHKIVSLAAVPARFRNGLGSISPVKSGQKYSYTVDLMNVDYRFLKGHKMVVHVQSTFFPYFARNTQNFIDVFPSADAKDYVKATHKVFSTSTISLPILNK